MEHTFFFQYNIPADNEFNGHVDRYVDVVCNWTGAYYNDGSPLINDIMPVIRHRVDLMIVKDWNRALNEMERIAQKHFAALQVNAKVLGDLKVNGNVVTPIQYDNGNVEKRPSTAIFVL